MLPLVGGFSFSSDGYLSYMATKKICFDPLLEPSWRDGSNKGSKHIVLIRDQNIFFV